jgi:hypothetical protein
MSSISSGLTTHSSPNTTTQFNAVSLVERMRTITYPSLSFATRNLFVAVPFFKRLLIKHKTEFKLMIIFSFVICAFAATDCEILNSGISSISSTACCTATFGITCVEGRVIEMYALVTLPSSSKLSGVAGKMPQELGNLTELVSIDIRSSDLKAGQVPRSIASCTKLKSIIFYLCKLQGEFPVGLHGLKSIGISILNLVEHLSLNDNEFTGEIPEWICELVLLTHLDLEYNGFDGKIPACIGSLILLTMLNLSDNKDLAGELPIGICDLVSLVFLVVEETSVEGTPPALT